LARGASAISKEVFVSAFFRSFRTHHLELQGESIGLKKHVTSEITHFIEGEKEKAEIGFNELCKHMEKNQMHLEKVFIDCDINNSGSIDKN
jgi:hypothetical protein